MIKCIAFDLDDTLYDEIDYYKSGFAVIADKIVLDFKLEKKKVLGILWDVFQNDDRKNTFTITAKKLGLSFDGEYVKMLVSVFQNHKPSIELPDDTKRVLDDLQKNYKLGVVTDGYLPAQEYKIQALGIQKYFGSIIYTEKIGREFWKPSPRGFEKLLKEMEIAPKQAVYVADNYEKDFIAPNKMGFQTIRIMRPNGIHTSPAASEDAMAKYEINSLTQLPALLKKINVL